MAGEEPGEALSSRKHIPYNAMRQHLCLHDAVGSANKVRAGWCAKPAVEHLALTCWQLDNRLLAQAPVTPCRSRMAA